MSGSALALSSFVTAPRHGGRGRKHLAESALGAGVADLARARPVARRWFADLLWRAFPAPSDEARARAAARVLGVSARQVRNWLAGQNDAPLTVVCAVIALAGCEVVLRQIEGDEAGAGGRG